MEYHSNWGSDIPLLLRNENWDHALFLADGKRHDELNEAQCLACHKPKESRQLRLYDKAAAPGVKPGA
jgi:hypothetical protein